MSWNYRVIEHETYDEIVNKWFVHYQIHEVYYDEHGENQWMTTEGCDPYGDTLEELAENVALMRQAFGRPALKATVFGAEDDRLPNWAFSEGT